MIRSLCLYQLWQKDKTIMNKNGIPPNKFGQAIVTAMVCVDKHFFLSLLNPKKNLTEEAKKSFARNFIKDLGHKLDMRFWDSKNSRFGDGESNILISTILTGAEERLDKFLSNYNPKREEGVEYFLFESLRKDETLQRRISYEQITNLFEKAIEEHYRAAKRKVGETGIAIDFHWNTPHEYRLLQEKFGEFTKTH
jgi:hypothetical protein